jgi:hypothetical protein
MQYSLSHSLKGVSYAENNVNPAEAYVAAVVAAGATVSAGQRAAIDTFYRAAKSGGYYSSLKRLYLPIWGVAAANAIDMITLASGTFNGSVTHAAGYVQGDGTTGWMDYGASPSAIGATLASASYWYLIAQAGAAAAPRTHGSTWGDIGGAQSFGALHTATPELRATFGSYTTTSGYASSADNFNTTDGVSSSKLRRTAGITTLASDTEADTGTIPSNANMAAMVRRRTTLTAWFSDARYGAYGMGIGLPSGADTSFSLALKNLWETATGLTLP